MNDWRSTVLLSVNYIWLICNFFFISSPPFVASFLFRSGAVFIDVFGRIRVREERWEKYDGMFERSRTIGWL